MMTVTRCCAVKTPEPEEARVALVAGHAHLALIHAYTNVPRFLPSSASAELVAVESVMIALPAGHKSAGDSVDLGDFAERSWVAPPAI
jgi:hypothetical protein